MRAILMFGAVAGVAERFCAPLYLAGVGLLAGVRPNVRLQVLQAAVGLFAALELKKRHKFELLLSSRAASMARSTVQFLK